jgi:hypothetical protein
VCGSEPMYTHSRRGITGPCGLQRHGMPALPSASRPAPSTGTPAACRSPAGHRLPWSGSCCCCFFVFPRLWFVPVPGLWFFRICDFLQDVVDFTTYCTRYPGSAWCEDVAYHAFDSQSIQRIRMNVRDCTHPN